MYAYVCACMCVRVRVRARVCDVCRYLTYPVITSQGIMKFIDDLIAKYGPYSA